MFIDTPHLDAVDKTVRIIGYPAIVGTIIWLVRTFEKGSAKVETIADTTKATLDVVTTTQNNHLAHIANDLASQKEKQDSTIEVLDKQTEVLRSIDKNISVLVDRSSRQI